MDEKNIKTETVSTETGTNAQSSSSVKPAVAGQPFSPQGGQRGSNFGTRRGPRDGGGRAPGGKRDRNRTERPRAEFEQKILEMRRVTRVVQGGRRFSFSVALVAGDKKGRVGVGLGKAIDTSLAIDKALRDAKKHMIKVNQTKSGSIPHEVYAKYSSARLMITPAKGRGIVAGSAVRSILELAGIKDVNSKIFSGSKNQLNIAQASIKALKTLKSVRTREVVAPKA